MHPAAFVTSRDVLHMDWILNILMRISDSCCFQQDQKWGFLYYNRIGVGFCACWRKVNGCLLGFYLCGAKRESNCLCHVVPDDSPWIFANQDRIWTKKNQSRTSLVARQSQHRLRLQCHKRDHGLCLLPRIFGSLLVVCQHSLNIWDKRNEIPNSGVEPCTHVTFG